MKLPQLHLRDLFWFLKKAVPKLGNQDAYKVVERAIELASNSPVYADIAKKLDSAQLAAATGTEAWVNIAAVFRDERSKLSELMDEQSVDGVCDYVSRMLKNQD